MVLNAEELLNVANDFHETVDFRRGVVEIKAGRAVDSTPSFFISGWLQ